jgi:hypothetical protein
MQIAHLTTLVNLYKANAFCNSVFTVEGNVGDTLNMLESLGAKINHDSVNPGGVFTDNFNKAFEVLVYQNEEDGERVDLNFYDVG